MILGIYGAGGMGREVLVLAQQINQLENRWERIIFIDDTEGLSEIRGQLVLSFESAKIKFAKDCLEVVIGVGEPAIRRILREKVTQAGYSLATLVHPSVSVPEDSILGDGVIVCCNNFVSCGVRIGENVLVQPCACVGHDTRVGSDSVISTFVCLAGGSTVGDETFLGMQVAVCEMSQIGSQSIVGMGSTVLRDIPDGVIAMGNPARAMKKNTDHRVFHTSSKEGDAK